MRLRTAFIVLLVFLVPLSAQAAKKKKPLKLQVTPASSGIPLVTLAASDEPLGEVADRLAKELGTAIDVSASARLLRVTTDLDQQPLDLLLRELAPQAYVDGVLTGGGSGKLEIQSIHLRTAGEAAPSLDKLKQRSSETIMFFGHTEDPGADPFEGKLDVTYRDGRLRVFGKSQPLSVVAARLADALGIPFELVGDSREIVDVSVTDATIEQAMRALTPSVQLYQRIDLASFRLIPIRLTVREPIDEQPNP
jgi:hypothetical protein